MVLGSDLNPLDYPFDVPADSFLWHAGDIEGLPLGAALTAGRIPVLASGSNASPSQLSRKFNEAQFLDLESAESQIPVQRVRVQGLDVVYAAHIAPYGAIPATVLDVEGCEVQAFVTWLTPTQFARMNVTEALGQSYVLRTVAGVYATDVQIEGVVAYASRAGALVIDGSPISLETVAATGRKFAQEGQRGVWRRISFARGASDGLQLHSDVVQDPAMRSEVADFLGRDAIVEGEVLELTEVCGTTGISHHSGKHRPYVAVVHPSHDPRLRRGGLAVLRNRNNGRVISAIAGVILDDSQEPDTIAMDQTLRTALGIARTPRSSVLAFVEVRPIRLSLAQRALDRVSWIGGRRYLLLRAAPPNPTDIEKRIVQVRDGDLLALGVSPGGRVLMFGPGSATVETASVSRHSVQALPLDEADCAERNQLTAVRWSARYPDVPGLLDIEDRNDLHPIWMDADQRAIVGVRVGDPVLVRRSLASALSTQLLDFGVVMLATVLALNQLLPRSPVLGAVAAAVATLAVILLRLRGALG